MRDTSLSVCWACRQHVLRREAMCPHCGAVLAHRERAPGATASLVAVLVGVGALGSVACSSVASDSEGTGGAGGESSSAGGTNSASQSKSAAAGPSSSYAAITTTSSYGTGISLCDDIRECYGDSADPFSGCVECAVLGDSQWFDDGGACAEPFAACFGDGSDACAGAGDPECCQLYDCLDACDTNLNGQIEPGPELDCLCTNDGSRCAQNQASGTCLGDFPSGFQTAVDWETCIDETCHYSCGG